MHSNNSICRICAHETELITHLCDSPPANNFDDTFVKNGESITYPLVLDFCPNCFNIQLRHCLGEELLYSNYSYVTPDTESLENHYKDILNYLQKNILNFNNLNIVEIGSNNGLLLNFLKPHVNSVLGIEPATNVANISKDAGIDVLNNFFTLDIAKDISDRNIKLVIARHMFAHNSDPKELILGMKHLIGDDGFVLIENAYALDTMLHGEFDQIYHEHMFYYSALSMLNLLKQYDLHLFDIFFSDVHGGSIVFIASSTKYAYTETLSKQIEYEKDLFNRNKIFNIFLSKIEAVKDFVQNKISIGLDENKIIASYGAPAKAFTMFSLLNLNQNTIKFCVDTTSFKIGKRFPVSNIPIISEEDLINHDYDILLVNAWNYKDDIIKKADKIFKPGTELIFPLPTPQSIII